MILRFYIWRAGAVVSTEDVREWAQWFARADRHVAQDMVGDVRVSTIFLGLDHQWGQSPEPILWETMIFGGAHDEYQARYTSYEAAIAGHHRALALVRA